MQSHTAFSQVSSHLVHKVDNSQIMSRHSLFCILLISQWITLGLIYWVLPWKQNYSFSHVFFSVVLIATVSKLIKFVIRLWVCLLLIDAELNHEGIVKGLLQFWAISDFSASLTLYSAFCVRCAPHHLPLAEPRPSSSHVPGVSLTNPKIKLRCQGSLLKFWDIWITHHQLSSPEDYFIFCSAPQPHSLCTFCLPQMPKSPLESRRLHWFILKTAPPHTRKKEIVGAEVRVKGAYMIMQLKVAS